jgi:hypothetical protein
LDWSASKIRWMLPRHLWPEEWSEDNPDK